MWLLEYLTEECGVIILMFGPPGCGKGTQACEIVGLTKITAISTGDLLRGEMKAGTELGKKAQDIMASGGLVSDELVNDMLVSRISQPDCKDGFLLDGYPRTAEQAKFLDAILARRGYPQPFIFHLDVPAEVVVGRITARRQCPVCNRIYNALYQPPRVEGVCDFDGGVLFTRKDDTDETVRERLRAYDHLTNPVLDYYRAGSGVYHKVDGTRAPEVVFAEIAGILQRQLVPQNS
jgi:adenylate kinase